MKWYSTKKYLPSYDGWYVIRWIDSHDHVGISYVLWNSKEWLDFNENDHAFKGKITHFMIPEPVEIE